MWNKLSQLLPENNPKLWKRGLIAILIATGLQAASFVVNYIYPVEVDNVTTLQTYNYGGTPRIWLGGYTTLNDGGQGMLVQVSCTGFTADAGVFFNDGGSNCFQRQFSGSVHLPWYGVKDATSSTCLANETSCNAGTAITSALAAADPASGTSPYYGGNGWVTTDGRSVVISASISIPAHQGLTCGGTRPQFQTQTNNGAGYWTYPQSLLVDPAATITVRNAAELKYCFIRPKWYVPQSSPFNIPAQNANDVWSLTNQESGTPVLASQQYSSVHDVMIVGFDTCLETNQAGFSNFYNIDVDCNIGVWGHKQGSGNNYNFINQKQRLVQQLADANGNRIDIIQYGLTNITNDGSGGVKLTISSPCTDSGGCTTSPVVTWTNGMRVLVGGLGVSVNDKTSGTFTPGSAWITNIPPCTSTTSGACQVNVGLSISDTGGCVPASAVVYAVTINDDGSANAEMAVSGVITNTTCASTTTENVTFSAVNNFAADVAQGLETVCSYTHSLGQQILDLCYASWAGPTFGGIKYHKGSSILEVYDTANIMAQSWLCSSGTPPACTPPTDFAVPTGISLGQAINLTTNTPLIVITGGTTTGAPGTVAIPGYIKIDSEWMGAYPVDSTHFQITSRGALGSTAASHLNGAAISVAAPQIQRVIAGAETTDYQLGTYPSAGIVWLNANAQNTNTTGITSQFANATSIVGSSPLGYVIFNNGYRTWSANTSSGPTADGTTTVPSSWTNNTTTLTLSVVTGKVQPGEAIADITTPGNIPSSCKVTTGYTIGAASVPVTCTLTNTVTADLVAFGGGNGAGACSYPTNSPWLGNCAPSIMLFGDPSKNDVGNNPGSVVTGVGFYLGSRVGIHLYNSPAFSITGCMMDSGGGLGAANDPQAIDLWLSSKSTKDSISCPHMGAPIALLDQPTNTNFQGETARFFSSQTPGDIILDDNANMVVNAVGGSNANVSQVVPNSLIFVGSGATASFAGDLLPNWSVEYDQPQAVPTVVCDASIFQSPCYPDEQLALGSTATSSTTLTATSMTGADRYVAVPLTGTLTGNSTLTTDTAANIIAATPFAQIGTTWHERFINESSANFTWTIAGGTGVTLTGAALSGIAQNTWREYVMTVTGLKGSNGGAAISMTAVGSGTWP